MCGFSTSRLWIWWGPSALPPRSHRWGQELGLAGCCAGRRRFAALARYGRLRTFFASGTKRCPCSSHSSSMHVTPQMATAPIATPPPTEPRAVQAKVGRGQARQPALSRRRSRIFGWMRDRGRPCREWMEAQRTPQPVRRKAFAARHRSPCTHDADCAAVLLLPDLRG